MLGTNMDLKRESCLCWHKTLERMLLTLMYLAFSVCDNHRFVQGYPVKAHFRHNVKLE